MTVRRLGLAVVVLALGAPLLGAGGAAATATGTAHVTLLAINDFHGRMEPVVDLEHGSLGGAAYLASHLDRVRADHPEALFLDAGDMTGATVGISNAFGDEPTVEVMNLLGLDVHTAGNHEFDDGLAPLRRLRDGGCWQADCGYRGGTPFPGAAFTTLSANVLEGGTENPVFPAWTLREVDGVVVGVVGVTANSGFSDAAERDTDRVPWWAPIPDAIAEMRSAGADVVVVLRHQGIHGTATRPNQCPDDPAFRAALAEHGEGVDVMIDGHTHRAYVCDLPDAPLLAQADEHGTMFTEVHLTVDRASGEVVDRTATNRLVTHDVEPDPDVEALIDRYEGWRAGWTDPEPGVAHVHRVSGADRLATAAALSRAFPAAETDTVLLARADEFADALVAGPLAAQHGAPLLLTGRDQLAAEARAELERLRPDRVILVGGHAALGAEVEAGVAALPWLGAGAVTRIAGADRYDTAARIAARIVPDLRREVFLATGTAFPDALAGAALAARWQAPVLLTAPDHLPAPTRDALAGATAPLDELVVLGGTAAVTTDVADEAGRVAGVAPRRIAGRDRYETAGAVAAHVPSFTHAVVATGRDFPDALAGVAAAAHWDAPVLLVEPEALPVPTSRELSRLDLDGQDGHVVIVGGEQAVSTDVERFIERLH